MVRDHRHVTDLQRRLNAFNRSRLSGVAPLRVDGRWGRLTARYVREAKFHLGYVRSKRGATVGEEFLARLERPNRWQAVAHGTERQRKAAVKRGQRRRLAQRTHYAKARVRAVTSSGVTTFDGRPVAAAFVPYLVSARARGWRGTLVSGYRDPGYSESLCRRMCGRPSCPGRCAGRSSRHSQKTIWTGAIDVSDYATFGRLMASAPQSPHIRNTLGRIDPVHFSAAGN
jgi:hypothetical protein